MPVSPDPRIGTKLVGYRVESLLGRGGMSVVYRADDEMLERKVALKFLAPELAADERFRDRFLRESRLAAAIEHPNIVPVYDAGEVDGQLYIAMRYVDGTDLKELLRREGPLRPERALALVDQVARALDAAHARKLVHRDVKPSNVLIADGDHAYLADFGLTKTAADRSGLTATGQIMGTVDYAAPEQIEGAPIGERSDVYALGCLLYECLTGEVPFPRASELAVLWAHVHDPVPKATARRGELPPAIDAVFAKALAKDPDDRYPTCTAVVEAARAALAPPRVERPRRLRRFAAAGAVAAAVLAATVAAAVALFDRGGGGFRPLTDVDSLAKIDVRTNGFVRAVEIPEAADGAAFVPRDAWRPWVISYGQQTVFVVNRDATEISHSFPAGDTVAGSQRVPTAIAAADDHVWVGFDCCEIARVDVFGGSFDVPLMRPGEFGTGALTAAAVAYRGDSAWVATAEGTLWRIDDDSERVVAAIAVDGHPGDIAVAPHAVWISTAERRLIRVDPRRNRVDHVYRVPFVPQALAYGFGRLWVVDGHNGAIRAVDAAGRVVRTIRVGTDPVDVAVGAGAVWVSDGGDGTVSRVDPATGRVVKTIHVGPRADKLAVGHGAVWVIAHPR